MGIPPHLDIQESREEVGNLPFSRLTVFVHLFKQSEMQYRYKKNLKLFSLSKDLNRTTNPPEALHRPDKLGAMFPVGMFQLQKKKK